MQQYQGGPVQHLTKGRRPVQEVRQVSRVALPHQFHAHPCGCMTLDKTKSKCGLLRPPFMTGHHFYSMSLSSFFLLFWSISSVQWLISNASGSVTRPHHQTTPSLRWWKEHGSAWPRITKEHASSGTWNLKELLLINEAKLKKWTNKVSWDSACWHGKGQCIKAIMSNKLAALQANPFSAPSLKPVRYYHQNKGHNPNDRASIPNRAAQSVLLAQATSGRFQPQTLRTKTKKSALTSHNLCNKFIQITPRNQKQNEAMQHAWENKFCQVSWNHLGVRWSGSK